jgi:hypothetical protein
MEERSEPVDLSGLALNRHTYFDQEGNQLPDVRYSYRRPLRRRKRLWFLIMVLLLALLLIARSF